ncbi:hypothetical protein D3C78_1747080 [compost metagenome]
MLYQFVNGLMLQAWLVVILLNLKLLCVTQLVQCLTALKPTYQTTVKIVSVMAH